MEELIDDRMLIHVVVLSFLPEIHDREKIPRFKLTTGVEAQVALFLRAAETIPS